jgi:HK97 family phage prohead protease
MKTLNLICEAKLRVQESADESQNCGKIEARVTTWGAREGADGRRFNYQPEGFKAWCEEFHATGKPLPMFLNHNDMGMPMGEWNEFEFDSEGMTAKGRIYMNTVGGSDLYSVLKESPDMFGGVSVGAYAEEAKMVDADGNDAEPDNDEAYFQITKGGLREVSVVMYPNNPKAEIQKLECFDAEGQLNPRNLEKVLREAGLSKKDATTASSIVKRAITERVDVAPIPGEPDAVVIEAEILAALDRRALEKALQKRIEKGN